MQLSSDIVTVDNVLHVLLGAGVLGLTYVYMPLCVPAALYLREQGQSKSWTLNWSFHKHVEWVIPSALILGAWRFYYG